MVGRFTVLLGSIGLVAVLLAGCGGSSGSAGGPSDAPADGAVAVVTGANFWGNVVSQIGGAQVRVTSIVESDNTDPHQFEANARDAAAIARADLVVRNGLGYDEFLTKLLAASPNNDRSVVSIDKVLGISGDNPNPHLWYDVAGLPEVSAAIVAALSKIAPEHAAQFEANGKIFVTSLDPILAVIATIKAKYAGTPIAYTERVPGYLVEEAGLTLGIPASFPQAVEDGTDPSPAAAAEFNQAIKTKSVRVLLYNSQVTDPATDKIKAQATSSGVPIVGVSETLPDSDKNFQAWQLRQDKELLAALGG